MKPTHSHAARTAGLFLALTMVARAADKKVSEFDVLTSGELAPGADRIYIVDMSGPTAKTITPNGLLTGWGMTSAGADIAKASNAAAQRILLSLVPGTNVQPYDADLTDWAGRTAPTGAVVGTTDAQTLTNKTLGTGTLVTLGSDATGDLWYRNAGGAMTRLGIGSSGQVLKVDSGLPTWAALPGGGDMLASNNLSDVADPATARANLGITGNSYTLNHGTAAGNLVRLDATTGKLPAVDGSLLLNLPGGALASQPEAEAGTENTKTMTPLRVAQAIAALSSSGGLTLATQAEAEAGTENTHYMTPLRTAEAITAQAVALTGDQTIAGHKTFSGLVSFEDDVSLAATVMLSGGLITTTANFSGFVALGGGVGIDASAGGISIDFGGDAAGDTFYRDGIGALSRLGIGSDGQVLKVAGGLPSWAADADTFAGKVVPSGVVVGTTDAQTLTNKTLGTGTAVALGSDATGDIWYRDAGGWMARLPIGTTGQGLVVAGGIPAWNTISATLGHWAEASNFTGINSPIHASSFRASGTATDIDAVFAPKGAGAIQVQVATGNAVGGNKRGTNSIDFQFSRGQQTQVTSGQNSIIASGINNTVAGNQSAVVSGTTNSVGGNNSIIGGGGNNLAGNFFAGILGGQQNSASGSYDTVVGGRLNVTAVAFSNQFIGGGGQNATTSSYAAIGGGLLNLASGPYSSVPGGWQNQATGTGAMAVGVSCYASGRGGMAMGDAATTRGVQGAVANASGYFALIGDAQATRYVLRRQTTDATLTDLTADAGPPTTSPTGPMVIELPSNSARAFQGRVIARHAASGAVRGWHFRGTIKRDITASTTALVGSVTMTDEADAAAAPWTLTVDADTTNGSLRLRVTGAAATTIRWVGTVDTTDVTY